MGISQTEAWFSVTKTKNVYDLSKFQFAYIAQNLCCEKLLIVSHSALKRVAEKMTCLEGNCILINNTGRSGSTLLCQVNIEYCSAEEVFDCEQALRS